MGVALGIGRGLQFKKRTVSRISDDYFDAVVADGGRVEAILCVNNTFTALNNITINQITPTNTYNTLVSNDGGSVESFSCVRGTFIDLYSTDILLYSESTSYQTAITNDSGSLESFSCLRNSFIELNNVAT